MDRIQSLDIALKQVSNRTDLEKDRIDELVRKQHEVAEESEKLNEVNSKRLLALNKVADHKEMLSELGTLHSGPPGSGVDRGSIEGDWHRELSKSQQMLADQRARYQATMELVKEVRIPIQPEQSKDARTRKRS